MMSKLPSDWSPPNPSAATPITVAGTASSPMTLPMPEAFPKMRRRYASLITTTASSDSLKSRPADARAPTTRTGLEGRQSDELPGVGHPQRSKHERVEQAAAGRGRAHSQDQRDG
jgi:hypothetical protein